MISRISEYVFVSLSVCVCVYNYYSEVCEKCIECLLLQLQLHEVSAKYSQSPLSRLSLCLSLGLSLDGKCEETLSDLREHLLGCAPYSI